MSTITPQTQACDHECSEFLRATQPSFPWTEFDDLHRALVCELYYGPLGADYWTEADPLSVPWPGFTAALRRVADLIDDLPGELYYFPDHDGVTDRCPDDDLEDAWLVPIRDVLLNREVLNLL